MSLKFLMLARTSYKNEPRLASQPASQPAGQPANQLAGQAAGQHVNRPTDQDAHSSIFELPDSFCKAKLIFT